MPNTTAVAPAISPGRCLRLVLLLLGGLLAVYHSEVAGLTRIAQMSSLSASAAQPASASETTPHP